ncbi:MAG: hypothetical protein [Caudoviricetes sp.]|nr:MAG: hypothetical protein [Caudoviricetes sp.]
MSSIIVPKKYLQAQKIKVNPDTFEPEIVIALDHNYYNTISKDYNIYNIYVDYSQLEKWSKETVVGQRVKNEVNHIDIEIIVSSFTELDEIRYRYNNLNTWVDGMYSFNKGYTTPVVIEVSEKEKQHVYSVRDATLEVCRRYIEILTPLQDIEKDSLESTSNSHLISMCETIISNDSLSEDKISRWLGFIQGVIVMKGYTTVNTERDFSRPMFHRVYKENGISIPKNTL